MKFAIILAASLAAAGSASAAPSGEAVFKQRCAVRYPDPCWQDPLTEAYGRELAGAIRALAPPPESRLGPGGESIVGVDYRRCRQASCAVAASDRLTS